ncbi:putative calcium-transporting ATPase 13, plasma membrane-type [Sesamum alatum]|uniref:Calcium-transporting ATPase n=1 Tax=Sesamum alatum TaxID=300844 RepID=A0AAE2CKK8_9LAMI|nr:putative calcium-transporting ATPase 13, plasma membrane-type [Sesamum alatum]
MDETRKPSSSVCHYRQPAPQSVSVIHQAPSPQDVAVIQMQQFNVVGGPADDLQRPDYTRHEAGLFSGLVEGRVMDQLIEHGGVQGVAATLETHIQNGIDGSPKDINSRKEFFGSNSYPARPPTKGFFHCVLKEFMDFTNIILLVCAALYLGLGIKEKGAGEGWYDGVSIFVAIFLVIAISAASNFRQNRIFDNLFEFNNNILVAVMRKGRRDVISIFEIVVGDIVCLKIGDQVPADGLFIEGHSLKVDESRMTAGRDRVEINHDQNPFLPSGSKIIDGYATMLVTAVGMNTSWGRMMSTITRDPNVEMPLHGRSRKLTWTVGMFGLGVALLVLVRLLVEYFTGKTRDETGNVEFIGSRTNFDDLIDSLVDITATAVVILVVAIPGGFSLAINLTLAHSTKRMMADKAVVRNLPACGVLASVETICTDMKRIIASKGVMSVPRFFVGADSMEGRSYTSIAANVLELFFQGIRHTSAHVHKFFPVTTIDESIESWAVLRWNMEMENIRQFSILNVKPSCSESWRIGISMKNQSDNRIHLHWKGDADSILPLCSHYYDSSGNMIALSNVERERFLQIIVQMASSRLRCVAFAHRQLSEAEYENEAANQGIPDTNLILLGLLGVEDHCHPGIREAFQICRRAGIHVKLVTSENVSRARAMVLECGILSPGEEVNEQLVVEAQAFFNYTQEEQRQRVGDIAVMAMSSDEHKLQMVQLLKENGHVVAVTGDCANDAPTLKEANIGIAMGAQSTEVAKECSDIIILDDNFANVVKVVRWGRCIRNNIQKFIQFQLTANTAFLIIYMVTILSSGNVPLTIAQLLWVNLIMVTLGALALATDKPTKALMKQPVHQADILVTNIMWKNMIAQALFQIAVILVLQFEGESIFGVHKEVIATIIFNTFVLCQVSNLFNARKLEEKNVFVGMLKNKLFIGITLMIVILQVILVEFLNKFAHTERLNWKQWAACIGFAALSWPFDYLIKCIPVPETPAISLLF